MRKPKKPSARLLIFFALIAAFSITTPIVWFKASGYRLDLKNFTAAKTGAIAVTALPVGTDISVKNVFYNLTQTKSISALSQTAFFQNFLPASYEISATSPGHSTWRKNINVQPQKTTWFPYVRLFPENTSLIKTALKNPPKKLVSSDNGSLVLSVNDKEISAINVSNGESKTLWDYAAARNILGASIFPGNAKILLKYQNGTFGVMDGIDEPRPRITPLPPDIAQASVLNKDSMGALDKTGAVLKMTEQGGSLTPETLAQNAKTITALNGAIDFLDQNNMLWAINADSKEKRQLTISPLSAPDPFTIISSPSNDFILILDGEKTAWLFDNNARDQQNLSPIAEGVNYARFSADNSKLLLASTHELFLYALKDHNDQPERIKGSLEIITRLSGTILSADFLPPEEEYALLQTVNPQKEPILQIVELDGRGGRNYATFDNIIAFTTPNNPPKIIMAKSNGIIGYLQISKRGIVSNLGL